MALDFCRIELAVGLVGDGKRRQCLLAIELQRLARGKIDELAGRGRGLRDARLELGQMVACAGPYPCRLVLVRVDFGLNAPCSAGMRRACHMSGQRCRRNPIG